MNRGAKQSPFVGKRVPLVDGGVPILYTRYTAVADIVATENGPSGDGSLAAAAASGLVAKKEKKKKRKHEDADEDATPQHASVPAEAKPAAEPPMSESKKRKKEKKEARRHKERDEQPSSKVEVAVEAAAPTASSSQPEAAVANGGGAGAGAGGQKEKKEKKEKKKELQALQQKQQEEMQALQKRHELQALQQRQAEELQALQRKQQEEQQRLQAEVQRGAKHQAASSGSDDDSDDDDSDDGDDTKGAAGGEGAAATAGGEAVGNDGGEGTQAGGNAEEADKIRNVMGFSGMSSKAAPSFRFGFSVEEQKAAEAEEKLKWIHMADSVKDGFIPRRVYVGGMPFGWEEEQVLEYWQYCGEVDSIDMLRFPDSGRFRGIAFITFRTDEGFEAAMKCDGEQLEKAELKVMKCKPSMVRSNFKAPTPSTADGPFPPPPSHGRPGQGGPPRPQKVPGFNVAYVGNIAFESTLEELQGLFNPLGAQFIRMHTDKASGVFKGYAHVHFADEEGVDRAMELDGHRLHGRGMRVSYGQPKRGEVVPPPS